jgi:uncharacterized integral membrane protein (TIGR00698 family)
VSSKSANKAPSSVGDVVSGLTLAIVVMLLAGLLARWLGASVLRLQGLDPAGRPSPISGISMAILLGLLAANTVGVPAMFRPGLSFAVKRILRLGIILVGIRLSFFDVIKLGAWGVPVVGTIVVIALLVSHGFARLLGVSDRLGTLAAASTAICGVTAALSVGPVIEAEESEVAYTVANVTLFGLVAMLFYPYLAHALFGAASGAVGLFLGTGIHDTSQVMGASLSYKELFRDERALQVATVTKLTRNVFLVAVVPALAYRHARRTGHAGRRVPIARLFPLFVLGFLGMAVVRSLADASLASGGRALGIWDAASWPGVTRTVGESWGAAALGTAMAGVGLSTDLRAFRALGWRPLYLGALSALLVAGVALLLASLVGPRL